MVQGHLISMEIPTDVSRTLLTRIVASQYIMDGGIRTDNNVDNLVKIDSYKGSWGL